MQELQLESRSLGVGASRHGDRLNNGQILAVADLARNGAPV